MIGNVGRKVGGRKRKREGRERGVIAEGKRE